jgi:hypothetical protein
LFATHQTRETLAQFPAESEIRKPGLENKLAGDFKTLLIKSEM